MTEEVITNNNDAADEVAALKKELLEEKNSKAALEMKAKKSEEALYDENYLAYLEAQKQGKQTAVGTSIDDYTEEQISQMSAKQLAKIAADDAYNRLRSEQTKETAKKQSADQRARVTKARREIAEFAKTKPDFGSLVPRIQDLSDNNPKLTLEQLYLLAGGKHFKKDEPINQKDKDEKLKLTDVPDTKPTGEGGVVKSDKDLTLRDVISQEWQKANKK